MSGTKRARVRPNRRLQIRSECENLKLLRGQWEAIPEAAEVRSLVALGHRLTESVRSATKTNPERSAIDARASSILAQVDRQQQRLEPFYAAAAALDRVVENVGQTPGEIIERQFSDIQSQIRAAWQTANQMYSEALQDAAELRAGLQELELWSRRIRGDSASATADRNLTVKQIQERLANEARLTEVSRRLKHLISADGPWDERAAWLSNKSQPKQLQEAYDQTDRWLKEGNALEAEASIEAAVALRTSMLEDEARNRADAQWAFRIARAISRALCPRDEGGRALPGGYDEPTAVRIAADDPLQGVRIRADAPNESGKGNITVDILLDGRVAFEIDNIPDGEAAICAEVIRNMANRLADQEMNLEVTDWGPLLPARQSESVQIPKQIQTQREQQRER